MAEHPFRGETYDTVGTTWNHYGLDETYETTITEDIVSSTPVWNPTNSNPPVSARQALQIAENFRRNQLRDRNNWKWGLESLTLYPLDGKNGKWCWCVLFSAYPESGGMSGMPPQFAAYVTMDGNTIDPKTGEYDYLKKWGLMESDSPGSTVNN